MTWRRAVIAGWVILPALLVLVLQPLPHDVVRTDFANLWFAGRAPLRIVYDTAAMTKLAQQAYPEALYVNFIYPPPALFLARLFGLVPILVAAILWNAFSALLFYVAARPYMKDVPPLLALLTPAALVNFVFGQWGLLIGAFWLWSFRHRPWAAALLILKPHLGFLAAVPTAKSWRLFLTAALIAILLVLASLIAFGVAPWTDFVAKTFGQARFIKEQTFAVWMVMGVTPLIGYPWWGWACFVIAASVLLARNFNVFSAATATFLISPYGFHYDLTVVSLGFGIMAVAADLTSVERAVAVLAFLSPALVRLGTWWIPPILLAGLYVQSLRSPTETDEAARLTL